MGFLKKTYRKFKENTISTFRETHFSIRPVKYIFHTPLSLVQINDIVGKEAGIFRNKGKYNVMIGYCRGNRMTLFKISFSARFLTMTRPFQSYIYKKQGEEGTYINGNFRFSLSTKILTLAWMMNDLIRLIDNLQKPVPQNIIAHLVSLLLLPTLLLRTVWKDKSQQQAVIDFVEDELGGERIVGEKREK